MSDRVSNDTQYRSSLAGLQRSWSDMYRTQLELSTGRRILTPSDDPTGSARVLGIDRARERISRYELNISSIAIGVESTSRELQTLSELYGEVRQSVVQGLNGTLDSNGRKVIADKIDQMIGELLNSANAQEGGRYIFSGSTSSQPPFVRTVGSDGIERVTYRGDDQGLEVPISDGVSEVANFPGSRVFRAGIRGASLFKSTTGARPGNGTNSATGQGRLELTHIASSLGSLGSNISVDPLSGLRLGALSAANDNVLGGGHVIQLTVYPDGTGGTMSLDGGPSTAFSTGDGDVALTSGDGTTVNLDVSSLNPDFSGFIPLSGTGTVSADGGQTSRPIDFNTGGMQVIGPGGTVTHLDATGIRRSGQIEVTHPGTLDVFASLIAIRDALRVEGTPEQVSAAVDAARDRLSDLDTAQEGIQRALADSGAIASRLESTTSRHADYDILLSDRRSKIADVDLSEVLVKMKEQESVYQSALYVSSRLGQMSLMNFLR